MVLALDRSTSGFRQARGVSAGTVCSEDSDRRSFLGTERAVRVTDRHAFANCRSRAEQRFARRVACVATT